MQDELLTAAEIARRAGVYRSTVGDWIKGKQLQPAGEIKRGERMQPLFSLKDAQPLIDKARARESTSSDVPSGPPPA